jgi:hypothetical protein
MLPTDAQIKFILCEVAREEKGEKVSLMGIYPDDRVMLPFDVRFPAAFPITFVYFLLDGEGLFNGFLEIRPPTPDQPPFSTKLEKITKEADKAGTIVIAFTPFLAFAFGVHDVTVTLDGQKYLRKFEVAPAPKDVRF